MQEIEVEYVTLEDGADYFIVDIINNYAYLKKETDNQTFDIRKIEKKDGDEYFIPIEDEEELNKALSLFQNKYLNKN